MFVILVYDAGEKRVQKFHKTCKRFLHWVQLSVFEGELSKAQLERLKFELKQLMEPEEDSIIIYTFRTKHYFSREVIGVFFSFLIFKPIFLISIVLERSFIMKGMSIFTRGLQVRGFFIERERGQPQSTSPKNSCTNYNKSKPKTYKKPKLIPFYDEFAKIRNPSNRKSISSGQDFSLSFFKARLYKLWKDVREKDPEAILEDMNRWVQTVWYLEGLNFIAANHSSLDFELHMKDTAIWKGRIVDLEFHLELHLKQSWAPATDKLFPNRLKFLAPNLVDTGRFLIAGHHSACLEILDKGSQQRMTFTDDSPGGSFSTVSFTLIDGTRILWSGSDKQPLDVQGFLHY